MTKTLNQIIPPPFQVKWSFPNMAIFTRDHEVEHFLGKNAKCVQIYLKYTKIGFPSMMTYPLANIHTVTKLMKLRNCKLINKLHV